MAALGANAFAAICYVIVWVMLVTQFKENDDEDAAKAGSCGLFGKDQKENASYGMSFAFMIVAMVLHLVAAGLVFFKFEE